VKRTAVPRLRRGPGPVPSVVVRRLDLRIRRRVQGLMPGDIRSTVLGGGTELDHIRPYAPGDDVRAIDWNVTARTGAPHVRLHVAERALTTWVVLDVSPSMMFGTQDRTKADVAEGVVLALSYLATSGANRLGVIVAGSAAATVALPPTGDRRRVLRLMAAVEEGVDGAADRSREALADGIVLADRVARRSGAVVIVSDFRDDPRWQHPLARSARRHHVAAVEVVDPREQRLTDAGEIVMADRETGEQLRVDTRDPELRRRFADAAEAERVATRRAIRGTGSRLVTLSTDGDWLRTLAASLARPRALAA
jgi:uncharacterized protein (DUF58 family)